MALSLYGERPSAAAPSANPLLAFARWLQKASAARTRRVALAALLELDHTRLDDLGIDRQDVVDAIRLPGQVAARKLTAARAAKARL